MEESVTITRETYDTLIHQIRILEESYAVLHQGEYTEYLSKERCKDLADAVSWEAQLSASNCENQRLVEEKAQLLKRNRDLTNLVYRATKFFGYKLVKISDLYRIIK